MKNLFIIFTLLFSMSMFAQTVGEDVVGDSDASHCSESKVEVDVSSGDANDTDDSDATDAGER